jgi:phosphohistidine phosphatase SixA
VRPSFGAVRDVAPLALLPMDAELSPAGLAQVAAQRKVLDARRFVATHKVQLVVHSHYARARDTVRDFCGDTRRSWSDEPCETRRV